MHSTDEMMNPYCFNGYFYIFQSISDKSKRIVNQFKKWMDQLTGEPGR